MGANTHPPRDSPGWDNPDYCPFCGADLTNGGPGFIEHIERAQTCNERFEDWRERVSEDIGGEWSG